MGFLTTRSSGSEKSFVSVVALVAFFLGAVVWILDVTSQMSKVIHNDHASLWVSLSTHELLDLYDEMDACVLSSSATASSRESEDDELYSRHYEHDIDNTPQAIHKKLKVNMEANWSHDCAERHQNMFRRKNRFPHFCRFSNCNYPLADRSFHLKELNNKLTRSISRSSFVQLLHHMASTRHAVVFVGDTVTKQNVEAMYCDVMKLDKSVQLIGNLDSLEHMQIFWSNQSYPLNVYYIQFNGILLSEDSSLHNNTKRHHVHHRTTLGDLKLKIDHIQSSFVGGITIIASVGSSYYSRKKFRSDIGPILDWLNVVGESLANGTKHHVFFRENAAQHWNSTAYGYQILDSSRTAGIYYPNEAACVPLEDAQDILDWRNREVHSYINNKNLRNINIIPFRDITAPLYNMHGKVVNRNDTSSPVDCTHFCYFPQLWQIVWTHLVENH